MPRGYPYDPALRVEARRLYDEGALTLREIAERLGVGFSALTNWIYDPDGSKKKSRVDGYRGQCKDCGEPTDGSRGRDSAPGRCLRCVRDLATSESHERIIEYIQQWAEAHGGVPPTATEWTFARPGERCSARTAARRFGSWNAAIAAAGFEPRGPGTYGRSGEDEELCKEIRARYEAGESAYALAREYGCAPSATTYRLRKAGAHIRGPAEARELARAA